MIRIWILVSNWNDAEDIWMIIVSGSVSLVGYPPMVPSRGSSDSPCGSDCRDVKVTVSSLYVLSP